MKRTFHFMMGNGLWQSLLFVFLITAQYGGYGQHCDTVQCRCLHDDLNPSGIMIGHSHPKGSWMFSYRYMNMQMRNNQSGTAQVSNDIVFQNYIMSPQSMSMNMHMLMAMYGISNRLSVMAMLNYNVLNMNMNMLPGTMQMQMNGMTMADNSTTSMRYKTSGLGDTRLYAMYTLVERGNHRLIASAGINLPTGSITSKGGSESMLPGKRLPYMMQSGTGTFDLLPGLTYLLGNNNLCWGTQLSAVFHPGYNTLGYAWGNEATGNTWLSYRILPWLSASARAEIDLTDRIYGKDPDLYEIMEPGAAAQNYGGTRFSGYLGCNVYLKRLANSRLSLEYGVPAYQNLNGTQLANRAALYAGWSVSF